MKNGQNNLLKKIDKKLKKIKAADIMTRKVVTIKRKETIHAAAELMLKNRISGLPVVSSSGKILGIITETDLFMVMDMVKSGDILLDKKAKTAVPNVSFAMSCEFRTVSKKASLEEIIVLMKYKNQQTVPVVEKGRMVGIIGKHDVFKNFYSTVSSCR